MAVKMERGCERESLICLTPFTLIYLDTRLPIFLSMGRTQVVFLDFSRNCELRFHSDFQHQQYAHTGMEVVSKFCMSEILVKIG